MFGKSAEALRATLERIAEALETSPEPRALRGLREEVHELSLEVDKLKRMHNSLRGKVYRDASKEEEAAPDVAAPSSPMYEALVRLNGRGGQ